MSRRRIKIYEVGPRDGLQNLEQFVATEKKREFIQSLRKAGFKNIEVTSFVHPRYVPQMADAEEVFDGQGAVLVMNQRGMDRALAAGATHFNIVFSPSETFNQSNLGCDLETAVERYEQMLKDIPKDNVRVYLSCFFGCPTEGELHHRLLHRVTDIASRLGNTVVFCDTVGVASFQDMSFVGALCHVYDINPALHLHVKEGRIEHALGLVRHAMHFGINEFDSSMGGLGGCPFVADSPGNLPTESLILWAEARNIDCGISSEDISDALYLARDIKVGQRKLLLP
tara:strand:+ start:443 stop:1294 length:852 start_codon:yes stop_codon:yes gene_type:complete